MKNKLPYIFLIFWLTIGCKEDKDPNIPANCENENPLSIISQRNFEMGFSTWSFGPYESDKATTYQFIKDNADIYSEQIDDKIPWSAWINGSTLPTAFTDEIDYRVSKKLDNHKLLLSVSLLNTDRSNLLEDYDSSIPNYSALNDAVIENAYFNHLEYLIQKFNPDYLVIAMEVNELKIKSETKWIEYKMLMTQIRNRIKNAYPDLPLAESMTLHNWYNPEVANQADFIEEISNYVNQHNEFAAISYYPFFKGQHTKTEFQQAFDFLHSEVSVPISFVETTHLAQDLEISSFDLSIKSNVCEQKIYLETLLLNAFDKDYEFIIWWAHRDYDELWESFPSEYKDVGKLWRDTGLLDEKGTKRPSYVTWKEVWNK